MLLVFPTLPLLLSNFAATLLLGLRLKSALSSDFPSKRSSPSLSLPSKRYFFFAHFHFLSPSRARSILPFPLLFLLRPFHLSLSSMNRSIFYRNWWEKWRNWMTSASSLAFSFLKVKSTTRFNSFRNLGSLFSFDFLVTCLGLAHCCSNCCQCYLLSSKLTSWVGFAEWDSSCWGEGLQDGILLFLWSLWELWICPVERESHPLEALPQIYAPD